jgi:hypothetical protein
MFIALNSQGIRTITTLGGSVRSIASTFIIAGWKIHYPARYYARDVNVIVFLSYDSAIGLLFLSLAGYGGRPGSHRCGFADIVATGADIKYSIDRG